MPELPEVETVCRGLEPHLLETAIQTVIIRQPALRWPVPANLSDLLTGQSIKAINRRGKYVLIQLQTGALIIHLGMSGSLRIVDGQSAPARHDHVDFHLEQNKILRYNDPRRFGSILWTHENPLYHPLIKTIGIEPLNAEFNGAYLQARAQGRKVPVKTLIMNGQIVAGIGNIYATEALFQARIYPFREAQSLSVGECQVLVDAIKAILEQAIVAGGTTLKDFVNSDGKPGYFSQKLYVYGRAGLACLLCDGLIQSKKSGQRTTAFCLVCQQ